MLLAHPLRVWKQQAGSFVHLEAPREHTRCPARRRDGWAGALRSARRVGMNSREGGPGRRLLKERAFFGKNKTWVSSESLQGSGIASLIGTETQGVPAFAPR